MQFSQPEPTLRSQVESAINGKPVRLVRIETSTVHVDGGAPMPEVSIDELSNLNQSDYFEKLYVHRYGSAPPGEIMSAFAELLNAPEPAGASS